MNIEKHIATLSHPLSKRCWQLIHEKQSNLCLTVDVTSADELLALVESNADQICMVKTHIDIVSDFTPQLTQKLRALAEQQQFLLFEDRKFADIGNTVYHQCHDGVFQIASWADIINAHSLPGPGVVEGLQKAMPAGTGLLLLAQLSCADNLIDDTYSANTLALAKQYPDFVMGFICQHKISDDPNHLHLTPGVKLEAGGDNLGQRYRTPEQAIIEQGCDIIIVGRGITADPAPRAAAERYRQAGWQALLQR